VHGQVLEQWPLMFQTLGMFREHSANRVSSWFSTDRYVVNSREQRSTESSNDTVPLTPDRLVRVPLDELQPDGSKQS